MITLHLEADSFSELQKKAIEALALDGMTAVPLADVPPKTRGPKSQLPPAIAAIKESIAENDRKREAERADTPNAESPQTEAGPATAEVEASEATDEPHALTYDGDIKPAVLKVSAHPPGKGGGREGVLALMAQFDVDHINKVPEAKWPELLDAINLVLEG